ncbi:MAG TPA: amino acid adenylation domain-containing protein, partial [Thermoanaerobaculia bacterium]|nr:amino acid adenylation domain-containing protein [Thermoanaerobaculia bacterium]
FMMADSGASVLLTQEVLRAVLPGHGAAVVSVDAERESLARESDGPVAGGAGPENLAYVIYTSGSTATPKGVLVPHRAYVNHNVASAAYYEVGPGDRFLQFASISFDVAGEEFFIPWLAGAAVVLHADPAGSSFEQYLEFVAEQELSILNLPASFWHDWVAELSRAPRPLPPSLRVMIVGNEKALPERFAAWRRLIGEGVRSTNAYGPTEDTVTTTIYESALGPDEEVQRTVPIGRPLDNKQVYVLDGEMRPVPVGVPGELYVGGAGLARGYLGRPDWTVEKFVPNPFGGLWDAPGSRLYRTGDLARYLPQGNVEFLGRVDHQVKIRGFRIELEEVETVLRQHPEVDSAVVLAREDQPGDKRLVAYLVGESGPVRTPVSELRRYVRERLPEYMVPSAFVALASWPLTPNGKLDRKALPAPEEVRPEPETSYAAPRTPAEELLADIWAEVLGLERVGVEDDFFELGGHSLLATRVVSRVREVFGITVPLRALFETSTVEGLARRIELEERGAVLQTIPRADRSAPLPLSFAQERLWLIDQLEPDSARYNLPVVVRMQGRLDVPVFAAALDEIARRHEVLRTTFVLAGESPAQVVAPARRGMPPVVDLGGLPEAERQAETVRLSLEESLRPFDLAAGPLLRVALLRLAAESHIAVVGLHHIVSDGWSIGMLTRELGTLYEAFSAGRPSPLLELAVQYADFAVWQRGWLQGEALESQLAYWRERLAGAPALLELAADRPRPAVQGLRGASREVRLTADLAAGLRALGRREGATLFMTLLGLFQALLGRRAGIEDLVVGSPIAGRTRSEVEPLIGFFVNTLVLRSDLSGGPGLRELLQRVRESALGAYAHQDVPFEKLVEELAPDRDLGRTPLFQAMFVLQNAPEIVLELPGLCLSRLSLPSGTVKFDLTLTLMESERGLTGSLTYSTDLFEDTTVARLSEHFRLLAEGAVADPDRTLAELPVLTAAERHHLLLEHNDTAATALDRSLPAMFAAQAARTPDAPAVADGRESWTYGELAARSARLAHGLQALGVEREVVVGLCLDRSVHLVAAALAVLRAGGAYLPLDPTYPAERLAFMAAEAGIGILVCDERHREVVPGFAGLAVTAEELARVETVEVGGRLDAAGPEDLAYLLFTSGSTGRPKGVEVVHGALANFLAAMARRPGLSAADTLLAVTTLSFDIAGLELFLPLVVGARVIVADRESAADGARLGDLLERSGATVLQATPATWQLLLDAGWGGSPRLSALCGGEALPAGLARRLAGRVAALWNLYGPTETTVWSAVHAVEPGREPVPVGRPIANTVIQLLDAAGGMVPAGVAGELHIGGAGLARGYRHRPDLTAERFIPDAARDEPGARLYRTGDLARLRPDGEIEYLGRIDHQVKVRGFRIELGEIESRLLAHPQVRAAVAVARDDLRGGRGLVAYVVPKAGDLAAGELRAFLEGLLPGYMVPQAFVQLPSLPLTPNGKVDRKALPAPETRPAGVYAAPRTQVEELLAGLWAEVLGLERVGVEDNFFELGGHSLLATRVVSRVRQTLAVELPLRDLFEAPTVAGLAGRVERAELEARMPRIERMSRTGDLPLSFAQQRLWFLDRLEPDSSAYNLAAAVRLTGPLDGPAFAASL